VPKDYRIHSLDALRGIAAVCVMYAHILYIYGTKDVWIAASGRGNFAAFLLARTPVGIFFTGGEAVILFFILSGFVLSLPFLAGHPQSYRTFAIRRICRIYPPYMAALFIAMIVRSVVVVEPIPGTTPWVAAFWSAPVTLRTVAGYLAMTDFPSHTRIDFVVWSLIHEMRISLIFPFLLAATSRSRLWLKFLAFFSFSFACSWLSVRTALGTSIAQQSMQTMLQTGSYIWFFVVGIELARHRSAITAWVASRRRISFGALFSLAACFYGARLIFPGLGFSPASDFIVGIGAAGFVVLAFGRPRFDRWMTWPPFLFLGKISYSLYLLHPIVLLAFVYALHDVLSPEMILIAIAPASVLAAWAGQRFLEAPSMRLGRALTATGRNNFVRSASNQYTDEMAS
jgi:peptidoglycan/LPS O-acetylase OafA/YrhL